jgi:hypothetical protein
VRWEVLRGRGAGLAAENLEFGRHGDRHVVSGKPLRRGDAGGSKHWLKGQDVFVSDRLKRDEGRVGNPIKPFPGRSRPCGGDTGRGRGFFPGALARWWRESLFRQGMPALSIGLKACVGPWQAGPGNGRWVRLCLRSGISGLLHGVVSGREMRCQLFLRN